MQRSYIGVDVMGCFNIGEVVELGVKIEEHGSRFYSDLAEKTDNDKVKDIFIALADEEKSHIAAFKMIEVAVADYSSETLYPDDYFTYVSRLADEHVFTKNVDLDEIIKDIKTDVDAVDLALRFEQESIKFFEALKDGFSGCELEIIDKLIDQEIKHVEKLTTLKESL